MLVFSNEIVESMEDFRVMWRPNTLFILDHKVATSCVTLCAYNRNSCSVLSSGVAKSRHAYVVHVRILNCCFYILYYFPSLLFSVVDS